MNRLSVMIGREIKDYSITSDYQEDDEDLGKAIHGQLGGVPFDQLVQWRGVIERGVLQTTVKGHSYKFSALDHRTGAFTIEPDIPA